MRKYLLLHILTVSFLFLYPPIIQAAEEPHITLISSYRDLSVSQVLSISNISIRNKHNYGFYGYSTIIHRYEDKSVNGDSVVTDHATGLMWHQSGSGKGMVWNEAKQWVKDLNNRICRVFRLEITYCRRSRITAGIEQKSWRPVHRYCF